MTTVKVHIAQADSSRKEYAIQILDTNPDAAYLAEHPNLVWINKTEETLYMEKDGAAVAVYQDTVVLEPFIKKVDVDGVTLDWNGSQIVVKAIPQAIVTDLVEEKNTIYANLSSHTGRLDGHSGRLDDHDLVNASHAGVLDDHESRITVIESVGSVHEFSDVGELTGSSTAYPCSNFRHNAPSLIYGVQKLDGKGWVPLEGLGTRVWVEEVAGPPDVYYLRGDIDDFVPSAPEPIKIIVE